MASTSPAKSKAPARKTTPAFEQTSDIDDDDNYTAKIFGEEFKLTTDVNAWLLICAGGGDLRSLGELVESVIVVEPDEGETFAVAQRRERDRFHDLLKSQQHLTVEKVMELVADMTESAGNDQPE